MSNKDNAALRRRIETLIAQDPSLAAEVLLEQSFWPEQLATGELYHRIADDTAGELKVLFGQDGDGHVEVISETDPEEPNARVHRFRTFFGGGESLRTRTALLILALAMKLDGAERSQEHRIRQLEEEEE
jgi:hypothetical protein